MPDYLNRMIAAYLEMPSSVELRSLDFDDQGRFWITSDSRLLSVVREKPLFKRFFDNGDGYYYTEIAGKKYYLHRLLALSFNQDPNKEMIKDCCEVHHLDRNKENNSLSNLVILTPEQHRAIHNIWRKIDNGEVIPWEIAEKQLSRLFPISE